MALSNREKQARWRERHKQEIAAKDRQARAERALWRPARRGLYDVVAIYRGGRLVGVDWRADAMGPEVVTKRLLSGLVAPAAEGAARLLRSLAGIREPDRRHRRGRRGKAVVRSDGVRFPSIRAAAVACGVPRGRIYYAVCTGRADCTGFRWSLDFASQSETR